jgi:hypothetical protein
MLNLERRGDAWLNATPKPLSLKKDEKTKERGRRKSTLIPKDKGKGKSSMNRQGI